MRGLSVGYRHNANKLNTVVGAEWMVFHSARKYLHQRLLPAITNSLSLSDEDSNHHLHQKKSGRTTLVNLPVFEIVFADIIGLYHPPVLC